MSDPSGASGSSPFFAGMREDNLRSRADKAEEQLRECREHLRVQTAALADDLAACRAQLARSGELVAQEIGRANDAESERDTARAALAVAEQDIRFLLEPGPPLAALQAKVARAVALLETFYAINEHEQIDPQGIEHIERALEALR